MSIIIDNGRLRPSKVDEQGRKWVPVDVVLGDTLVDCDAYIEGLHIPASRLEVTYEGMKSGFVYLTIPMSSVRLHLSEKMAKRLKDE